MGSVFVYTNCIQKRGDLNPHRSCRGQLHRPVRTPGDSSILFSRLPQGKTKCSQVSSLAPEKWSVHSDGLCFCLYWIIPVAMLYWGCLKKQQEGIWYYFSIKFFNQESRSSRGVFSVKRWKHVSYKNLYAPYGAMKTFKGLKVFMRFWYDRGKNVYPHE